MVFTWLFPTASLGNQVLVTSVLTLSPPARQRQMMQGSARNNSYEAPQFYAPLEYNFRADNMAGTLVFAEIVNVKNGRASKLRLLSGGAAPGAGESHFVSPSVCSEWPCRDNALDVRDVVSGNECEEVCAQMVAEW